MSDYRIAEPTCPEIDAAISALEALRDYNSNLRMGVFHYRELYEECKAQLAQRDAALKAADDLVRAVESLAGHAWSTMVPNALAAYRKARGQDATAKG